MARRQALVPGLLILIALPASYLVLSSGDGDLARLSWEALFNELPNALTVCLLSLLFATAGYFAVLALPLTAIREFRLAQQALAEERAANTERESSFRESRERFDLAVRGSSDGIWDWNILTGEIYVSERWCELLGYRFGEIRVRDGTWAEWVHPDDVKTAIGQMHQHFKLRTPYRSEYRIRVKSGEYRWFLNQGQAIWNEQGRAVRIAGSSTDIHDLKQIQEKLLQQNALLSTVLENFVGAISLFDRDLRLVAYNGHFKQLLEFPDALFEKPAVYFEDLIRFNVQRGEYGPGDPEQQVADIVARARAFQPHETERLRPNGTLLEIRGTPLPDGGFVTSYIDITKRKAVEEQLRKLSLAVEQSPESIVITNLKAEIEYVNEAFVEKTGYSRAEVIGRNPRILHSGKTPPETFASFWEAMTLGQPWKGEFHNRRKDGSEYFEQAVITPIRQPNGDITHYVAVKEDITARKAAEEQINMLAFYDPLTNLPNRRLFLDRLQQALASSTRSGRYGALLFIDLDNFKTLNDTLGHDIGDLLLRQVAQRLTGCVREGDTVSRLGGDEFLVMLEDLSESAREAATQAETVGEKVLERLNETYQLENFEHRSTPSIGITLFVGHQGNIDELMKRADMAMYQAKAAGRNTLRFFDPEMQALVAKRVALESDLREAVLQDQFQLYYQAQVVGEGVLTGAEVLLRWRHPERGMVSPAEFIPLAEETGLILPLGHWVLQNACQQLALWAKQPEMAHLSVAVNVSARQFSLPNFVEEVLAIIAHNGTDPHRLKLELTEGLLVHDVEDVITKMTALKARGVGFSMDDFGTGYSSLSYLKRLPLDQLKIDQSFTRNILTDSNDAAIAKMVVALAESMNLTVIAEGVEIEAQRDFLAHRGCHAYQGYLFSRPLPLAEFESLVQRTAGHI